MNAAGRIAVFAIGLLVVFAGAAAAGALVEPADTETDAAHGGGHAEDTHSAAVDDEQLTPAGLAISEGGYTLRLAPTQLRRGEARELRFSIADPEGEPVAEFDELHERRMHLILVRRDGTGFRHLHPEMGEAGTWTVPVTLPDPGAYRVFADFSVSGEQRTLATDLFVSGGDFGARPFPPASPRASIDGYEVRLHTDEPRAAEPTSLTFAVDRGGEGVDDLAPYLGAKGHLVALREGDLAFLHVHPVEAGGGEAANEIAFEAIFPTAGRYRLYLQFKHGGTVRTAEFTVEVPQ